MARAAPPLMGRIARTNLVLAGVVAVLGVLVWRQIDGEVASREPPLGGSLDASSVDRVAVRCAPPCRERTFERSKGRWRMTTPYAMDADDAAVARLVAIAASPVRSRRPLADFDPARIGLAPPQVTLELAALHFDVGLTDALRGDRYVRFEDTVAMVPDRFSPLLAAAPENELDRHLVPRDVEVTVLRLDGVARPDLAAAWRDTVAAQVAPRGDAEGSPNGRRIDIDLADGSSLSYRLDREGDTYIARRGEPALVYALGEAQAQALLASPP